MSLEDDFCDIIKKSRHGQTLSVAEVARQSHLAPNDLEDLEHGVRLPNKEEVASLAHTLNLRNQPLANIAIHGWTPNDVPSWTTERGLVTTTLGDIGGYEVKGYLLTDYQSNESVMVDTGYNAKQMLQTIQDKQLILKAVCLTHGHTDHAGGLKDILAQWPVPVYIGEEDLDLLDWTPPPQFLIHPSSGETVSLGSLNLKCLTTPGHTPGGYCFSLKTTNHALCFVGDTLFSGSIGRSNPLTLYPTHLASVREIVLMLEDSTVLLPGHGPATTAQEERSHNPFA